ncbi:PA domain-containing protein [Flavobacterium sp.]|uniref:T9SS type A sorting domain-containing protein n=1 Tax=Flavobacterium sp. TaxID=239 RepID=UPI00375197C1
MKRNLFSTICALLVFVTGFSQSKLDQNTKKSNNKKVNVVASNGVLTKKQVKELRKKHANYLAHNKVIKTYAMSKKERLALGLAPNKYFEQEWLLTMNPTTGKPEFDKLKKLRDDLNLEREKLIETGRTPGDASDNNWVERGPTNVGGRTRAIMFDPNDVTYNTVFAGGVSGGLWKNTNISSAASSWTRVNIPENLNISCIKADPVTPTTFYVGTGESYTGGDAGGDGVWKSTNSGVTWTRVLGGITGPTVFQSAANVTVNSPAGIAGNYACFPTTSFGSAITTPIIQNVVLVIDDTAPTSDGCTTLTNAAALNGKIALIRRGVCSFAIKVKAAQDAGALAVIMMNNAAGTPVAMGGTDATITIPSCMISQADGNILETALGSGTVNATLNPSTPGMVTGNIVPGIQFINEIAIRNNGGISEIFVANGDSFSNGAYMGSETIGVYKSADGGASWSLLNLPLTAAGNKHCPNDIAIGADNKIWVSTTESTAFNDGGGKVFSSSDGGVTFVDKYTVTGNGGGDRTQIEASATNANKIYVLAGLKQAVPTTPTVEVKIIRTTDGFATSTATSLPAGNGSGREVTYGFTGGQAFYDLMIKVDPSNDQILYVGGIDLSRSADGGNSWTVISNWTSNVHSDQHAMAFKPNNSNIGIFGNDGGVYYSGSLSTTGTPATSRNTGFNVTQFYSLGVAPSGATGGNLVNDYFAAGAQDNGSQYFSSAVPATNTSVETQGGDGAYTMFDQGADKYYITNYIYNQSINRRTTAGAVKSINSETTDNGAFISPMALDSSLDILYSDYTTTANVYGVRRYTNVGLTGTVAKAVLTNALLTGSPTAITVSKYTTATSTLLVGTRNNKLLRVTGANAVAPVPVWADITGSGFVGSVSDVEFGASNSEILVTFGNYGVVNIWYSSDAGVTWQNKEGNLPDLPVKCILRNPLNTNEVIIGTELGVWYTNTFNNASPVWNQSYNGMSNVKVTDLDLRNDNAVYAATYGRGIFSGVFTTAILSTKENDIVSNSFKVYPTVNNGNVTILSSQYFGQTKLNLFDISGKNVFSNTINLDGSEQKINLGNLSSGNYILKISGENFEGTKKLVIE